MEAGNRLQGVGSVTDWRRTRAFCLITNGVFVNLRGREPQGIVPPSDYESIRQELMQRLCEVRDPDSGKRIIFKVQPREEVYEGPFFDYAPDLIITEFDERYHLYFFPTSHYTKAFNSPGRATGNHTYDGILIGAGPDIEPGAVCGARLVDLMPTMCTLMGLDIPQEVDGNVLAGMLRHVERTEIGHGAPHLVSTPRLVLSDAEQQGLEERLRGLGYL
jgi:predicted AlkP superfamily phosphohydrolase/phosphomutase